jgi:hypothetical protein
VHARDYTFPILFGIEDSEYWIVFMSLFKKSFYVSHFDLNAMGMGGGETSFLRGCSGMEVERLTTHSMDNPWHVSQSVGTFPLRKAKEFLYALPVFCYLEPTLFLFSCQ